MLKRLRSGYAAVLFGFFLGLMLTGCSAKKDEKDGDKGGDKGGDKKGSSKVTQANADKLKDNMTEKEVIDILGDPTDRKDIDAKEKQFTWKDGNNKIEVFFKEGKLIGKSTQIVTPK